MLVLLVCGPALAQPLLPAASTMTWRPTGAPAYSHCGHTATLLPSGKVLFAGSTNTPDFFTRPEVYDPDTGTWAATSVPLFMRDAHAATLLPSGKVLVSGGYGVRPENVDTSAELYDPDTGTWTATGSLLHRRAWHTSTLLPSGKVLVVGGSCCQGQQQPRAELYDPDSGVWTDTGSLLQARESHTATLLPSGKVLVAGGRIDGQLFASAELYDPDTGTWTATGSLHDARTGHTAALLPGGKVLVVGGWTERGSLASAEVYDPATGTWTATGSLTQSRYAHRATQLPGGKVLVVGGLHAPLNPLASTTRLASTEVYDPETGTWTALGSLAQALFASSPMLLPSGQVLVVVGCLPGQAQLADVSAPETMLTSAPDSTSSEARATFTFSSFAFSRTAATRFECSLDGAAFTDCSSPSTISGLAEGTHSFQVRARDDAGHVDATPASHSWTVSLTPPEGPVSPPPPVPPADNVPPQPSPVDSRDGWGCASGPGTASWWMAALVLLSVVSRRSLLKRAAIVRG